MPFTEIDPCNPPPLPQVSSIQKYYPKIKSALQIIKSAIIRDSTFRYYNCNIQAPKLKGQEISCDKLQAGSIRCDSIQCSSIKQDNVYSGYLTGVSEFLLTYLDIPALANAQVSGKLEIYILQSPTCGYSETYISTNAGQLTRTFLMSVITNSDQTVYIQDNTAIKVILGGTSNVRWNFTCA